VFIKCSALVSGACYAVLISDLTIAAVSQVQGSASRFTESQGASLSQHSMDMSLNEAVSLGLRRNYNIRSLKLQRAREKFNLYVTEGMFNPKLKLSGEHRLARGSADRSRTTRIAPAVNLLGEYGTNVELGWNQRFSTTKKTGELNSEGLGLTVIQPLLRGAGKEVTSAPLRLAHLTEQVNKLNVKSSVSETLYQIVSAYRALMKSQNQVVLATNAHKRAVSLLAVNELLIASGRVAKFDAVQIEADIATQELAVEEAKNQQQASRLLLLKLLALDLSTPIRASDSLKVVRLEIDQDTALRLAQANQPQFLSTLLQSEQAALNLLLAQDKSRWDLSLEAGVNQLNEQHGSTGANRAWDSYTGLKLEIPIGDRSSKQGEVHAQTLLEQQKLLEEQALLELKTRITDAIRGLDTLWRQLEISQRVIDLSKRKLAIETEKLNAGRSTNFQIISFEADLRAAEDSNLNAQMSYLDARAQLDLLLGVMLEHWEISLEHF